MLRQAKQLTQIAEKLGLHLGTIKRWKQQNRVPEIYFNDLNRMLGGKYESSNNLIKFRKNDQFYTTPETANYCYKKFKNILKQLEINHENYTFIEPSAGCGYFFNLLPRERRIGIDIEPKENKNLIKHDFLTYKPDENKKYIVFGNPPFGLRGNLALRFINHSEKFADVVAFILPPLFNSDGKGVPKKRVKGYKLAHTEDLPRDSFVYPDGKSVNVSTIFQVWTKINKDKIDIPEKKTCKKYIRVYSLSDGGTPSSTRNKKMLNACDVYLPSTCFSGMRSYKSFNKLPNNRGYGVVIYQKKEEIKKLLENLNWEKIAFLSTNSALNLRTSIIENEVIKKGYFDE